MILNTKMLQAIAKLVDSNGDINITDDMTIVGDITITGDLAGTQIITPQIYGSEAASGGLALGSTSHGTKGNITVGRMTLSDLANADGITFGSLGTATKGIDLSSSGLQTTDALIYFTESNAWTAGGNIISSISLTTVNVYGTTLVRSPTFQGQNNTDVVFQQPYDYNMAFALKAATAMLIGNYTSVGTWAADGVSSAGTANITDVGGAAHGLSLAVGDMVHIQDCTTASHKGFYRIVTAGATTLVLDRVLAATDTDLTVTFYKDVIGFFATDGVNGQRITGYSHQDKPLQIGGDVLKATANMTGNDVLVGHVLGFVNRVTEPGGALTDGFMIYAEDSSDNTSSLSLYLEQAAEDIGTFTPTHKIKVQINSVWYWVQLDAV